MRSRITTLLFPALLLALPHSTIAQWTNDPYNGMAPVAASGELDQYPQLVRLSTGYTLVIWFRMDEIKIKYQILNPSGVSLLGLEGQYIVDGDWETGYERFLIPDGEGGAICVFDDLRDGYKDVYGQRFDPYGNRLWGATGLPLVIWPEDDICFKDVAYDSLGNIFLAWNKNMWPINEIFIQKVSMEGELLWGDNGVMICGGISACDYQEIVADSEGGVITVWRDYRISPYYAYLYVQHLDADGNPLLRPNGRPVLYPSGQHVGMGSLYDAVSDGEGGGIWAYQSPGYSSYLFLIRLTGEGNMLWYWQSPRAHPRGFADMISHPGDGTIWYTNGENRGGVVSSYLYRFDMDGNPLFGNSGLPYGSDGEMTHTSDGVITVDVRWNYEYTQMWANRVDSTGALVWQSDVGLGGVSPGGGSIFYPMACVSDAEDGAIVAFRDSRNQTTAPDISAQRVLYDGTLGSPKRTRPVIYPSLDGVLDFSGGILCYTLPEAGKIKLELFDILGRRVAIIDENHRDAGTYTVDLDKVDLTSGIYLVRLSAPYGQQTKKVVVIR